MDAGIKREPKINAGRPVLEFLCGLVAALPVGFVLYYFVVMVYETLLPFLALLVIWPIAAAYRISGLVRDKILQEMDFGTITVILSACVAIVTEVHFTRAMIRRGYRVLAWVQLPPALAVALWLFYLSLVHHKPLLPFYGQ